MYVVLSFPDTLCLHAVFCFFWSQSPARQNGIFAVENEVSPTRCTSIICVYCCNQKLCQKHWDGVYLEIFTLHFSIESWNVEIMVHSTVFSGSVTLWNIVPILPIWILKWSVINNYSNSLPYAWQAELYLQSVEVTLQAYKFSMFHSVQKQS